MGRRAWVFMVVCVLGVVGGALFWVVTRDPLEAQIRAAVEESLEDGREVELGPLMREQDASSLVVVCPYNPPDAVEADTGIRVGSTSNEMTEASVDLVLASGSEVRDVVTLPTRRYDVCSGLGDYDVTPVFGADVLLSARQGDAASGGAEVLVSLVQ